MSTTCHRLAVSEGGTGKTYSGWPIKKKPVLVLCLSWRQSQPPKHFNIEQISLYYDTRPLSHLIVNLW